MYGDIYHFVASWLPDYARDNRNYLTVAIGCTGGQHRSVYLVERLAQAVLAALPGARAPSRHFADRPARGDDAVADDRATDDARDVDRARTRRMSAPRRMTLAFTGASGMPFGLRLLECLLAAGVAGRPRLFDRRADGRAAGVRPDAADAAARSDAHARRALSARATVS